MATLKANDKEKQELVKIMLQCLREAAYVAERIDEISGEQFFALRVGSCSQDIQDRLNGKE